MRLPVARLSWTSPEEFIHFWLEFYADPREEHYVNNIGRSLTPERVRSLYFWKNGGKLSERKKDNIERNVIGRLAELRQLDKACPPLDFLTRFERVGPVWSIFLLHIWQPDTYPIYDQHTHRAMRFTQCSRVEEIPNPRLIAQTYVNDYVPFFNEFPSIPDRKVDKALFAFGRFLKSSLGRRFVMADGGQRP